MTIIALPESGVLSLSTLQRIDAISDRREQLHKQRRAPNTLRAYQSDWAQFVRWCDTFGIEAPTDPERLAEPVPINVVDAYVIEKSRDLAPATIARHMTALRWWHHAAGYPSPTDDPNLIATLEGVRRAEARGKRQARPLYLTELEEAVGGLSADPKGIRDRAVLCVGWWGALRRSELVGIDRAHLTDHPEGVLLNLPKSKTDQEAKGREVPLHYHAGPVCPVRALRAWLDLHDHETVFVKLDRGRRSLGDGVRLHPGAVNLVVKAAAERLGISTGDVSAHSLRSGFVSECDRRRIPTAAVRAVTGHTSEAMLSSYARPGALFDSSAGAFFNDD